jgi:hypothetical protein
MTTTDTALIAAGLAAALATIWAVLIVVIRHDGGEPEHPGADDSDPGWYGLDGPACRVCGCTEDRACPGGCWWATDEEQLAAGLDPMTGDLCSACLPVGVELHDMAAYAAEAPPEFTIPDERRRLTDDWPQQISPPDMPELGEPELVRPYVRGGRHRQEDTVDLTALRRELGVGQMPPVGAARLRAALDETAQMGAIQ